MTKLPAPDGTERHRDQARDQELDHETKRPRPKNAEVAQALLAAVAAGAPESWALAKELGDVVLRNELVRRALALDDLLNARSHFALVRAVELADRVLAAETREADVTWRGSTKR